MAGSLNKVILIGNVGADPEIRRTQDGKPIANFSLATSERWRDRETGERKEKSEWHRIVCFNEGLNKVIEQYVKKGSKLAIEGKIATRKWQGQDGQDRYSTEIVLQGFNCSLELLDGGNGSNGSQREERSSAGSYGDQSGGRPHNRDFDDEIPFSPEWRG